jgi:LacI family transcriptional regulator
MERTGYQPNYAARAMRTNRTQTIGVVVANILNPFYPALIAASSRELNRLGYRMILWESEFGGEQSATEAIAQRQVDGVLFTSATAKSGPLAAAVGSGAPTALINRIVPNLPCDQIDSNNEETAFAIASYLAAAGHSRVGLITADRRASTASLREDGFRQGAKASALNMPAALVKNGDFTHEGGHRALKAMMMAKVPAPTAVFCVNDLSALGAIDAAQSLGLRVPEDLWIVGYDDIDMASWESVGLTTARQPIESMVTLALETLLERIENPSLPFRHYQFATSIQVRQSTAFEPFTPAKPSNNQPVVVREWTA